MDIVRSVQAGTVLSSAVATGGSLALSFYCIPMAQRASSSSEKIRQFRMLYSKGHYTIPTSVIPTGLLHLALAAWAKATASSSVSPSLELLAGSVCIAIAPYSLTFLVSIEEKLLALDGLSEENLKKTMTHEQLSSLIKSWGRWNAFRAMTPLAGAAIALYSVMAR